MLDRFARRHQRLVALRRALEARRFWKHKAKEQARLFTIQQRHQSRAFALQQRELLQLKEALREERLQRQRFQHRYQRADSAFHNLLRAYSIRGQTIERLTDPVVSEVVQPPSTNNTEEPLA
eukprot:11691864-Prorocentrum_lima.AAC.1